MPHLKQIISDSVRLPPRSLDSLLDKTYKSVPPCHPLQLYEAPVVPMASPTHGEGHDSPDYYYLFVGLSAIALLLFAFNVMAIKCCASCQFVQAIRRFLHLPGGSEGEVEGDGSPQLAPVSKYKVEQVQGNELDTECSVCLSVFQDGEEVRQLPQCKHLFHAPCIDMWLHSHSNCPLCRANVSLPTSRSPSSLGEGETRQRLSGGTAILVVTLM